MPNDEDQDGRSHIFVINDTPAILDLFRELLEDEGFRVTTDTFNPVNLDRELAAIRQARPDLVILDYMIGAEGVGWQLLQLLRMDRQTSGIPVIVCTGAVRQVEELQPHLAEMGVTVVLKPFDIDILLGEVRKALSEEQGVAGP
jgi:DNA-binding response OmpR family regulator